jgi:hypothetical protein
VPPVTSAVSTAAPAGMAAPSAIAATSAITVARAISANQFEYVFMNPFLT